MRYLGSGILLGSAITLLLAWGSDPFIHKDSIGEVGTLLSDLGPVRLTQGRMDGQIAYAPYPTPIDRSDSAWVDFQKKASDQTLDHPGSRSWRDAAFAALVGGHLDWAINDLEGFLREETGRAPLLLSDLSALYGERARRQSTPMDYVSALNAAQKAVTAAPDLVEPRFNFAIALENLFLYEEAQEAWRRYLEIDNTSDWAVEARRRLKRLGNLTDRHLGTDEQVFQHAVDWGRREELCRLSRENPNEAREFLEEKLLPKWAEAVARGEHEKAVRRVDGVRLISRILASLGRDSIFEKIAAEMAWRFAAPEDSQKAKILIGSLRRFRLGLDMLGNHSYADALKELVAAEQGLRSIKSVTEMTVGLQLAICQYLMGDFRGSQETLGRLDEDSMVGEYPSLEARRQMLLGSIGETTMGPTQAINSYKHALEIFRKLGDRQSMALLQSWIAEVLDSVGRSDEGWQYRYHALAWAGTGPRRESQLDTMSKIVASASFAALAQRNSGAALVLQSRSIVLAKTLNRPASLVFSLLIRARIEAAQDNHETARHDFVQALQVLQVVHTRGSREELAPYIDITHREIDESGDRASAIALDFRMSGRLGARTDFDFRRGDTRAAESSLREALGKVEARRRKLGTSDDRVSFLDQAQPLYERMVALQLHLGHPEKAVEALERFRARAFLDQMKELSGSTKSGAASGIKVAPLGRTDMCRRLPADTAVISYAEVEGQLVSFLVRRSGILVSSYQPPWGGVASWANGFQWGVGREDVTRQILKILYRDLVAPWRQEIRAGERIIFIPTQSLYKVPFAALIDPATGRFLVQDHAVGVAPSISGFISAEARDRKLSSEPLSSALLVGNPKTIFTRGVGVSTLSELPGAAREIESLATVYNGLGVHKVTGAAATPKFVLTLLDKFDLVHFAVHAVDVPQDPASSCLMLSSQGSKPGELFARDILRLHLPRTRLVMLAACGTQSGSVSASEGSLSLAYSFLMAGVPAVVGSLWHIDDASTMRFSIRFHRELMRGADAISALRNAQLEEIASQSDHSDWTWASFQLFGGVAAREPQAR